METVVVGIDGSDVSRAALEWAIRYCRVTASRLVLVHAFDVPDFPPGSIDDFPMRDPVELAQAAEAYVRQLATALGAPSATRIHVVQDRLPARALLRYATGADLLVVGSRSRGGLARLVLGSVSRQCIDSCSCPVVVIPAHARAGAPEPAEAIRPAVAV